MERSSLLPSNNDTDNFDMRLSLPRCSPTCTSMCCPPVGSNRYFILSLDHLGIEAGLTEGPMPLSLLAAGGRLHEP